MKAHLHVKQSENAGPGSEFQGCSGLYLSESSLEQRYGDNALQSLSHIFLPLFFLKALLTYPLFFKPYVSFLDGWVLLFSLVAHASTGLFFSCHNIDNRKNNKNSRRKNHKKANQKTATAHPPRPQMNQHTCKVRYVFHLLCSLSSSLIPELLNFSIVSHPLIIPDSPNLCSFILSFTVQSSSFEPSHFGQLSTHCSSHVRRELHIISNYRTLPKCHCKYHRFWKAAH